MQRRTNNGQAGVTIAYFVNQATAGSLQILEAEGGTCGWLREAYGIAYGEIRPYVVGSNLRFANFA